MKGDERILPSVSLSCHTPPPPLFLFPLLSIHLSLFLRVMAQLPFLTLKLQK